MLATERLAADLITPRGFPRLTEGERQRAREDLAHAFQLAWIDQCERLIERQLTMVREER